ncbi:MAG: substrate-binding domain-containing protein, partial [Pseudomonadota bacterium]
MSDLRLTHGWHLGDATASRVEPALVALLAAIEHHGSLQRAARELALSYRHAWGLVTNSTHMLGAALVKLERGRGATLTALGKELLRLDRKAQRQLAPHFARLERELAAAAQQHADRRPATLVLHASHDLTLETLRDLAQSQHLRVDLHFKGSLESLESFARGASDIAGFHVPDRLVPEQALRYRKWLKPESVQVIHLFDRQQGLVVARGNPKRIRRLRDLARSGVRFVNRQQGSGTRLLLDSLLAAERLPP